MNVVETLLINFFIALMLFILWAWDLPQGSLLNRGLHCFMRTGLFQWTMLTSLLLFLKPADLQAWLNLLGRF